MDPVLEKAFLGELALQCDFAILASKFLAEAVKERNHRLVWYSVNSLLSATGNISKIFWPPERAGTKSIARGEHFKKLLLINENSPLNSRDMRNTFEHFDERIEKWFDETKGKGLIDQNMGNVSIDKVIKGASTSMCLRYYNYGDNILNFQDTKLELMPLYKEIEALHEKLYSINVSRKA